MTITPFIQIGIKVWLILNSILIIWKPHITLNIKDIQKMKRNSYSFCMVLLTCILNGEMMCFTS